MVRKDGRESASLCGVNGVFILISRGGKDCAVEAKQASNFPSGIGYDGWGLGLRTERVKDLAGKGN